MALLLLLTHPLALLLWALFTNWAARRNATLIATNGAKDSLGTWWHIRRTLLRLAVALVLAGLASLPAADLAYKVSAAGLLAGMAGWFAYRFAPLLNELRGKAHYYVSTSASTSATDKLLSRLGIGLRPVTIAALVAGGVAYGAAVVWLLFL